MESLRSTLSSATVGVQHDGVDVLAGIAIPGNRCQWICVGLLDSFTDPRVQALGMITEDGLGCLKGDLTK